MCSKGGESWVIDSIEGSLGNQKKMCRGLDSSRAEVSVQLKLSAYVTVFGGDPLRPCGSAELRSTYSVSTCIRALASGELSTVYLVNSYSSLWAQTS